MPVSGTHHYAVRVVRHWPKFYRYRVAEPGLFRWTWNDYHSKTSRARIGFAVVIGHHAYCVKWADSKVAFRREGGNTRG
jgi:hypothetical protein